MKNVMESLIEQSKLLIIDALKVPEGETSVESGRDLLLYHAVEYIIERFLENDFHLKKLEFRLFPQFVLDIQVGEGLPDDYDYQGIRQFLIELHLALAFTNKLIYGFTIEYGLPISVEIGEILVNRQYPFDLKTVKKEAEI